MPTLGYLSGAPRVSTHPDSVVAGARSHVLGVIQGFRAQGWKVVEFIFGNKMPRVWSQRGSEIALKKSSLKRVAADLFRFFLYFTLPRRAWRGMRNEKLDWVYERMGSFQALGRIFKNHGKLWILETNAIGYREAKKDRAGIYFTSLAKKIELAAYRDCDFVVCVSDALKEELLAESHLNARKIIVLPNGVDVEKFNPNRNLQRPEIFPAEWASSFVIGFVGSIYRWQSIPFLIRALHPLIHDEGLPLRLLIVGEGEAEAEAKATAAELGMNDAIRWAGHVSSNLTPHFYRHFNVSFSGQAPLSGNKMYHSPLKIYESLAMGTPVIASAFPDAKRELTLGFSGFLFDSGDIESLQRAVRKAYAARETLAANKNEIRSLALRHSWANRIKTLCEEIESQR